VPQEPGKDLDYDHARSLKRDDIAHQGNLSFVTARENVMFFGPPDTAVTPPPRISVANQTSEPTWEASGRPAV